MMLSNNIKKEIFLKKYIKISVNSYKKNIEKFFVKKFFFKTRNWTRLCKKKIFVKNKYYGITRLG